MRKINPETVPPVKSSFWMAAKYVQGVAEAGLTVGLGLISYASEGPAAQLTAGALAAWTGISALRTGSDAYRATHPQSVRPAGAITSTAKAAGHATMAGIGGLATVALVESARQWTQADNSALFMQIAAGITGVSTATYLVDAARSGASAFRAAFNRHDTRPGSSENSVRSMVSKPQGDVVDVAYRDIPSDDDIFGRIVPGRERGASPPEQRL